jgi:hypothetical protein
MNVSRCIVFLTTLFACSVCASSLSAQSYFIPLQRQWIRTAEKNALRNDSVFIHLGEKPWIANEIGHSGAPTIDGIDNKHYSKVGAKVWRDHLVDIRGEDFRLMIDPLFDITGGRDVADTGAFRSANLLLNQRGLQVAGNIGKQVHFETSFYESQATVPDYLRAFNNQYGIYPGFGRTKTFGENGYDFALAMSNVTYTPNRHISVQMGQGKHFYGHGYRSVLWSDATMAYPFIKARATMLHGKLIYSSMYAELRTLDRLPRGEVPESLYKPKGASVHYLSFLPNHSLEIAIFESIICNRYDSTGTHGPSAWVAAPIVGAYSISHGFDDRNNSMVGINARWRISKKTMIYGQWAVDDWTDRRFASQIGISLYDLIIPGLDVQLEYDRVSEYTYASPFELQNYVTVNQPLGHPAGGGTQEAIAILNYSKNRWWAQSKVNLIHHVMGPAGDFNTNPDVHIITIAAWPQRSVLQVDCEIGWMIQPQTRTAILAGCTLRNDRIRTTAISTDAHQTAWLWIGLRSHFTNKYYDYQ